MRSSLFYPYVSCVLEVAPEVAGIGFDFTCRSLSLESPRRAAPSWIVEAASGQLMLGHHVARAAPEARLPLRAVRGVLRPAGWGSWPAPVQLELVPWSRSRSELGLISVGRSWFAPSERSLRAYLRATHDVLDVLRRALEAPPPAWLARLAEDPGAAVVSLERGRNPGRTVTRS